MDRHDVSEEVTAKHVAELHQQDLKIQHKFGCKGLTYWFDAKRKTAFCLVEAPSKAAIKEMHDHAHGAIPHRIIEVDAAIVESFLGRIEDPAKSQKITLNIINDPAFRTIMVVLIKHISVKEALKNPMDFDSYHNPINETVAQYKGRVVKRKTDYILVSFDSVTKAVQCASKLITKFFHKTSSSFNIKFKIGLSAGIPVTHKEGIFEDTIQLAERFCEAVKGDIIVSSEVKDLYQSENLNHKLENLHIHTLDPKDENFLNQLMDFTEKEWKNSTLNMDGFCKHLGYSKSQFYRKMIALTGKSPNYFIKDYRLKRAIQLLDKKSHNISEIAFETGFNTPAYFTKCFQDTFGILPSHYLKS